MFNFFFKISLIQALFFNSCGKSVWPRSPGLHFSVHQAVFENKFIESFFRLQYPVGKGLQFVFDLPDAFLACYAEENAVTPVVTDINGIILV